MSTTNSQLLRDSLGLLGVLMENEAATPEQTQLGLRVMNEGLDDLKAQGIDLQYVAQTEPGATCPLPDNAISAVKHLIAIMLAPYFDRQISATLAALGDQFYSRLVRAAMNDQLQPVKSDTLPYGDGQILGRAL